MARSSHPSFSRAFFSCTRNTLLLTAFALACSVNAAPPQFVSAESIQGCPYDAATFKMATGLGMKWMKPVRDTLEGIITVTCRGIGEGNNAYAFVVQEWTDAKTAAKRFAAAMKLGTRGGEALVDDPDHAIYLHRSELKSYSLVYVRGNVMTTVRVASPPKESIAGLKKGLSALRRLP